MHQTISSPTQPILGSIIRARAFAKTISLIISGLGCLALVGWIFHIEILKSVVPGLVTMKALTAVMFVLCGISLHLQVRVRNLRTAQLLAAVVILISLLVMIEYIFDRNFGIDQFLISETTQGVTYPGRPAFGTALCFSLAGLALLRWPKTSSHLFQDILFALMFVLALMAMIGYLYGVASLYHVGFYSSMALHTSIGLLLLALGILFAHPDRGMAGLILAETAGGRVLQRLLPVSILLPIALGWICLQAQNLGLYDTDFGLAILVTTLLTTQTVFILINAGQLNEIDLANRRIFRNLHTSEARFRHTIEGMTEGFQLIGLDWRHIYVNDAATKNTRVQREQLIGRSLQECFPGIENTAMYTAFQETMQDRQPRQLTSEYRFPDGTSGWYDIRVQRIEEGIFILSTDITEHQRAEQALLEREMKLAKILDILPVGITILDEKRNVIYANPAVNKVLQLTDDGLRTDAHTKRTYQRVDGTPMPPGELPSNRAVAENQVIKDVEIGVVKENGNIIWTSVSAVPVNFSDWKVLTLTSDITPGKLADERFRLAVESAPNAIVMIDQSGKIILANSQAKKCFGYPKDEMLGISVDRLVPQHSARTHPQHRAAFFAAPQRRDMGMGHGLFAVRKDGSEFPVEIGLTPIETHDGLLVMATIIDITERKQAEEALRESEKKYSLLFDKSSVPTAMLKLPEVIIVDVNEALVELAGYSRQEMLGKTAAELGLVTSEEQKPAMDKFEEQGLLSGSERYLATKAGEQLIVVGNTNTLSLRGTSYAITTMIDITARKRAEQQLHELNTELEGKVTERTAELAQANEQLRQIAIIDEMTGLYNRRGFLFLAEQQLLLAKRSNRNILIFYADLDHLKQINDLLGHHAGDQAIIHAAEAINKTFRNSDIKARLGGDEFIILAIEAHKSDTQNLISRLQHKLARQKLSMSIGVIGFDPHDDLPIETLITQADQAMYAEKQKKPGHRSKG